jgi:hypothetical protein
MSRSKQLPADTSNRELQHLVNRLATMLGARVAVASLGHAHDHWTRQRRGACAERECDRCSTRQAAAAGSAEHNVRTAEVLPKRTFGQDHERRRVPLSSLRQVALAARHGLRIKANPRRIQSSNALMEETVYTEGRKRRLLELLVKLDIYWVNSQGAVRRKDRRIRGARGCARTVAASIANLVTSRRAW